MKKNQLFLSTIAPDAAEEAGGTNILVAYFSWADNAVLADDVDAAARPGVGNRGILHRVEYG